AKPPPPGTPGETEPKEPQAGALSTASTVVERSESTCVKVTGFSQTTPLTGKSPSPTEAGHDAIETESTKTHSVATIPDGSILVSSDACGRSQRREDLDPEDMDVPSMVGEYASEIYDYRRKLEITTMPDPKFMERQPELNWRMWAILADWMLGVHSSFRLVPETFWLATNLLDRFLSRRIVALPKVQLLATGCMIIASNFTEILCPSTMKWVNGIDSTFGANYLRLAERYILKTLEYKISSPSPWDFLRRLDKADDYDMARFQDQLLKTPPSLLAASAYWLARIALQKFEW
ncbi:G2/mitotic-specific cyclin, partial [Tulasnella sp. UAMH 9824]